MKKFDLFIVSAPKDQNKIKWVLESVFEHIKGFENIYLCTPKALPEEFVSTLHYPIHYRTDKKVLNITPNKWKYRPNWIYQQFIKLFQNETANDWYYVIDSDTILNKPLSLWEDGKPVWHVSWEQNNRPYYDFMEKMFGYGRLYNHSFLSDMGFYSKTLIKEMLLIYGYTVESFMQKSYSVINQSCYPSEADIYMTYIHKHYPDMYVIRQIENRCNAKHHDNPLHQVWTEEDIRAEINKMRYTTYDTFAIHSWCNRSHNSWR